MTKYLSVCATFLFSKNKVYIRLEIKNVPSKLNIVNIMKNINMTNSKEITHSNLEQNKEEDVSKQNIKLILRLYNKMK